MKQAAAYQKQLDDLSAQLKDRFLDYSSRELCCQLRRKKKIADANEKGLGDNPIKILGGEDFPQNQALRSRSRGAISQANFLEICSRSQAVKIQN